MQFGQKRIQKMESKTFNGDALGKRDIAIAAAVGVVFSLVYLVFSARGIDPSLWSDMCVSAGLRPPQAIFPGLWRLFAKGMLSLVGVPRIAAALRLSGSLLGGFCVFLVYLIMRQTLAFLSRTKEAKPWNGIAPLFSLLATVCFGAGDAMWRMVSPLSPAAIRFVALLVALNLFFSWIRKASIWRVIALMFLSGAIAAESTFGFLLPLLVYVGYRLALNAVMDGRLMVYGEMPSLVTLPRWRMFFAFVAGLVVVAAVNVWSFSLFGGLAANGWGPMDVSIHYAIGYLAAVQQAATPIGWLLAVTFSVLPLVGSLVLFPMLCRDTEPIRFKFGLVLFFAGILALVQCGVFPYARLWSFSSGAAEVSSEFLECILSLSIAVTLALSSSCFTLGSQRFYDYDADEGVFRPVDSRSFGMRYLVLTAVVLGMIPCLLRIYRPAESEMRAIVHDALVETVRECGDAKFIFTDGRLDAGLELVASQMGSDLKPLAMMSGTSQWETFIRTRHFEEGTPDYDAAKTGIPVLLRVWAGEKKNGMDESAVQLGFEFWRRARKPLPAQSGLVAREKGFDDAEIERGASAARSLAARILFVAKNFPHASVSPALRRAVSSVSWRISRFARMRDEEDLANELDEWNDTVKQLMRLVEYERMRTFMQMTPYEGLRLALRRADFAEARRYGATVLQIDPEDPEANFGTGMAYLMEDKLKEAEMYLERTLAKRPEEPAVLNNLSIIYRKTNRLEKALEYVKKAHELMPANEEILRTLKDTERAMENRKSTLKSAFEKK